MISIHVSNIVNKWLKSTGRLSAKDDSEKELDIVADMNLLSTAVIADVGMNLSEHKKIFRENHSTEVDPINNLIEELAHHFKQIFGLVTEDLYSGGRNNLIDAMTLSVFPAMKSFLFYIFGNKERMGKFLESTRFTHDVVDRLLEEEDEKRKSPGERPSNTFKPLISKLVEATYEENEKKAL